MVEKLKPGDMVEFEPFGTAVVRRVATLATVWCITAGFARKPGGAVSVARSLALLLIHRFFLGVQ